MRQAAAYGCGVLGQCGDQGLAQAASQAVPLLCEVSCDLLLQHSFPTQTKCLKFQIIILNLFSEPNIWEIDNITSYFG